jgi:hypothetical protein
VGRINETIKYNSNGVTLYQWESRYWKKVVGKTELGDNIYAADSDTTFCLINKSKDQGNVFWPSLRISGKFLAKHFPWLKKQPIPLEEQIYYLNSVPPQWSETGNSLKII